jgi:septal ring-binding cell division protein DamX
VQTRWSTDLPAITPDGELALLGEKDVALLDPEKLSAKSTVAGGAKDFWYFFAWDGFRPRPQGLDQPVTFPGEAADSLAASSTVSSASSTAVAPPPLDSSPQSPPQQQAATGFTVSFAALLSEDKAQQLASTINVGGTMAHVVTTATAGSPIYRVVLGPYPTRDEALKVARASRREYWVYEGSP